MAINSNMKQPQPTKPSSFGALAPLSLRPEKISPDKQIVRSLQIRRFSLPDAGESGNEAAIPVERAAITS